MLHEVGVEWLAEERRLCAAPTSLAFLCWLFTRISGLQTTLTRKMVPSFGTSWMLGWELEGHT